MTLGQNYQSSAVGERLAPCEVKALKEGRGIIGTGGRAPHLLSALGLLCHTSNTAMTSQKVLCLGFVRENGMKSLSLILLLYIYISLL